METPLDPASLVCQADWGTVFSPRSWEALWGSAAASDDTQPHIKPFSYTTTWEAVQAAAKQGCNWCRLILLPKCTAGKVTIQLWREKVSDCTPQGERELSVKVQGECCGFSTQNYLLYTTAGNPAAQLIAARDRITDLSTPESFRLARECIDRCLTSHESCPQPSATTLLPDRVIDCSDAHNPRITLTGGSKRAPYLALSYVWGGPQPMTTTTNIDKYVSTGIPLSILPPTIRDAITVTRSLGQKYLWIDALCILQDSGADKVRQLGEMRRIYRDSYLTLNAACAASTWEGFLSKPRPQRIPHARVPFRSSSTAAVGVVCLAKRLDTDAADASRTYWDELEPIAYRGWTLQEKLLPPRSLVYARDTLKYHCQTDVVSIGGALCEPSTGMRLPRAIYDSANEGKGTLSAQERKVARQAWLSIVFMYTLRQISHEDDKLPAVGGVAEQYAMVTGEQYLAGLWSGSLLFDLLWSVHSAGTDDAKKRRPARYRAPSWSWASVDGLIEARWLEETAAAVGANLRQAEVVGFWVALAADEAPFGEVRCASLRIKAVVKKGVEFAGKGINTIVMMGAGMSGGVNLRQ
ncbi:heterokaryon incompatibility protein-domain-containing protein [Lasiosphaeris hirsuta]|uniref:Heterokaryon incompatibility protein-domain-containing protein n=1 Tax=Lasiosphaeris hirsuta TaxID=260670 RepID=A0AA39ZPL2_9PEZI|nr:heterokaryon incompatibility protein-domain-containing protein [Lasiosphaeris hirsuta]